MAADNSPQQPLSQDFAYWMGRVDAKLTELQAVMEKINLSDGENWRDFRGWRQEVDARLAQGSENFRNVERRLLGLEEKACPLGGNCPVISGEPKKKEASEAEKKGSFGTWEWFRDNYLDKTVAAILAVAVWKLIELIVINWSVPIP